jgi:hypothetical protein
MDDLGVGVQFSVQRVQGAVSFGVKLQERESDHSPPSSAEVKNRAIILSQPYKSSWHRA